MTTESVPSLIESPEHDALRMTIREVCRDVSPQSTVAANWSSGRCDEKLWHALTADVGVTGLLIPEAYGGTNAGSCAAAVVCEELGRAVSAVPFLPSAVLAVTALFAAGDAAADALRSIADGTVATLAVPLTATPGTQPPAVDATYDGETLLLHGTVEAVLSAAHAELLVVPAAVGDEPVLALVQSPKTDVVVRSPRAVLDETRPFADLHFDATPALPVLRGADARAAIDEALILGATLLAAEQLGVAAQVFDDSVAYLRTRHQFGRPLGSFQALRHRAADLWIALTGARAAVQYAVACHDEQHPDRVLAAHLAAAVCSEVTLHVAEESLQLHGGCGFTWEAPVHLHLKRAAASLPLLGTPEQHRRAVACLVDLPPVA